jgi:tetratricopeptide (TPR) repeat protein
MTYGVVRPVVLLLVVLSLAVPAAAQAPAEKIGTVSFQVSCTPAAQAEFNRATAMLHSFWFDVSRQAYEAVAVADPACAMAYWGVAMTLLNNPLASPPTPAALVEGWAAVEKAMAIGPKTPRERDYVAAVAALYRDPARNDHRARVLAYEKAMERVVQRYPDDREAAVFYALALNMAAVPGDKTYTRPLKAAALLEQVFAEQPNHPGVAHYLIHSYDYPPIAGKGVGAARRYASIAPSAPHALHMPSHIFTRLGYWDESITTNRASAATARDHGNKLHAMDYMAYAYLQTAQDAAARTVLDEARAIEQVNVEHIGAAYALAAIPARYALERGRWADAAALTLKPAGYAWARFPMAEAVVVYVRGLGAARSGDAAAARRDIARLGALEETLTVGRQAYWAEQTRIQRRVVSAWLARLEGRHQEALDELRAAADLEDRTEKHPVTPGPVIPARELLGEMLLEMKQPAQALAAFEHSMSLEPNRFRGLAGAARAAELSGDRDKARRYYGDLLALARSGDGDRPELKHAAAYVGTK